MLSIVGELNVTEAVTDLQFANGCIVRVPTAILQSGLGAVSAGEAVLPQEEGTRVSVIPVIEEQLELTRRTVVTGKVLLEKSVEAYDVTLDEPLAVNSWRVERVPMGHVVQTIPATRQEETTTIYPVLEERMVLTKELVLVEEIRVTRAVSERRDPQTFTLRREHLDVSREDVAGR